MPGDERPPGECIPLLRGILDKVVEHLEYERDRGCVSVEASPSTVKELGATPGSSKTPGERVPAPPAERATTVPVASPSAKGVGTAASPSKARDDAVRAPPAERAAVGQVTAASGSDSATVERRLAEIAEAVKGCRKCRLHETRVKTVPGQGSFHPELMFIGEAPGYEEDQQGMAFVGAAGELLTRMIQGMGFSREEVFIANIVKCRPPENRVPQPDEASACMPYLRAQIEILRPKVIVLLGAVAAKSLLKVDTGITQLRGIWTQYDRRIDVMPTYHPSYLLRFPTYKNDVWSDLKMVLKRLGREPPKRRT